MRLFVSANFNYVKCLSETMSYAPDNAFAEKSGLQLGLDQVNFDGF